MLFMTTYNLPVLRTKVRALHQISSPLLITILELYVLAYHDH